MKLLVIYHQNIWLMPNFLLTNQYKHRQNMICYNLFLSTQLPNKEMVNEMIIF